MLKPDGQRSNGPNPTMKSANGVIVRRQVRKPSPISFRFGRYIIGKQKRFFVAEKSMEAPPCRLAPGFRFLPNDEQLLQFYLSGKVSATNSPNSLENGVSDVVNLIKELDPFDFDPSDLPDSLGFHFGSGGRKKHWFYYTFRVFGENRGRVRMKSGYWRRKGGVKKVIDNGGIFLGRKRVFVFYLENSIKKCVKTDWMMYEYALADQFKASHVLHRVFISGQRNRIPGYGLSSYGEGSVSAVCYNGNQQDGVQVTNMADAEACEGDTLNTTNDIAGHEIRCAENPNYQAVTDSVSAPTTSQVPSEAFPCEMMTPSLVIPTGSMPTHVLDEQMIISILEEDFIELDDLVG